MFFTLDRAGQNAGLRYSVVDLSLEGGLGAVTSQKNILIYSPSCEKISVVKHANDVDYWVVTHSYPGNTFYTHLVTSAGISTTPVVSNVGLFVPNNDSDHTIGCLKFSPAGDKVAVAHFFLKSLQLLDFDNATGQLSNPITLMDNSALSITEAVYGVEFSPNGEMLYVPAKILNNYISQFNLSATNIPASRLDFHFANSLKPQALQVAPDGKIYIAHYLSDNLSVIANPNVVGTGCNLQQNSFSLGGKKSQAGFPSFSQSYFYMPSILFSTNCQGESTSFFIYNKSNGFKCCVEFWRWKYF